MHFTSSESSYHPIYYAHRHMALFQNKHGHSRYANPILSLYNGNPYTRKTKALYWNDTLVIYPGICIISPKSLTMYMYCLFDTDPLKQWNAMRLTSMILNDRQEHIKCPLWNGWYVSSWWPLFPSRSSVLVNIYVYMLFYMGSVFFGLPIVSCSRMIIV